MREEKKRRMRRVILITWLIDGRLILWDEAGRSGSSKGKKVESKRNTDKQREL